MKLDTRWLEWRAPAEAGEPGARGETPTFPKTICGIFEASPCSQTQNFSPLEAEPAAYQEAFDQWLGERCVFRDRAWGGIPALHNDYAVWCDQVARDVPAGLRMFAKLLRESGSFTDNGLVYGVLLREDGESRGLWPE